MTVARENLRKHWNGKHPEAYKAKYGEDPEVFHCAPCDFATSYKASMYRHLKRSAHLKKVGMLYASVQGHVRPGEPLGSKLVTLLQEKMRKLNVSAEELGEKMGEEYVEELFQRRTKAAWLDLDLLNKILDEPMPLLKYVFWGRRWNDQRE